jgi:DNA-binding beta-propeller fold protein YncE
MRHFEKRTGRSILRQLHDGEGPLMGARELRSGSSVLGYQVEALVGRGGMGVVYRVFDPALHRHVALKLIAPELALDEDFRERFLQESRAVAALEHPNVVPVYSAGQLEDTLYLAMRYVEGSDLRQLLADGPLPPDRAIDICAQVAAALDAAHARGLVHRDVKPSNILVGDGDHVYLGDFGLSRRLDADGPGPGRSLGTIAYVAPEQIRGERVDGRADCYSLACVLYECLAGEPPFAARSDAAVLFAHLEAEPPAPPDLGKVFAAGLAKNPEDRYDNCSALIDTARQELGLQPRRRRRWPLAALAAAVLVVAAVGIGAAARRHGGSHEDGRLAAIDASSGKVVGHAIRIGDQPRGVAADSDHVWATTGGVADGKAALWRIDPSTGRATQFQMGGLPRNVAVAAGDAWVGDDRGVQQFDGTSGNSHTYQTTGDPPFVTSKGGVVWASGPDLVYRIRPTPEQTSANEQEFPHKVGEIPNLRHPDEVHSRWSINGLTVDRHGGVWVIGDAGDQRMWRINQRKGAVRLGFPPSAVAYGAGSLWVTDQLGHRLVRIDPATRRIVKSIPVGGEPMAVAVAPTGVWVADALHHKVLRIDARRQVVAQRVWVGFTPTALAASGDRIWVAGNAR